MRSLRCQINPNKLHEGQLTAAVLKPVPFAASCWWSLVRKNVTRTVFERICLRNRPFLFLSYDSAMTEIKPCEKCVGPWSGNKFASWAVGPQDNNDDWGMQNPHIRLGASAPLCATGDVIGIFQATRKAPLQDESMSDKTQTTCTRWTSPNLSFARASKLA